ncbi:MAG: hypothetical protein Kow0062_18850 [Acidobacteriota bacterium]
MRSIRMTLVAAALLACAGNVPAEEGGTPAPAPADAPRIVVAQPTLDLGVVREGETVRAEFIVENAGRRELRILRAKPS